MARKNYTGLEEAASNWRRNERAHFGDRLTFSMSFHAATFRLLPSDPEVSTDAQRRLIEAERRLGILLPSSLLQWYERRNAIPVLAEHSNDDPPVEIDQFETIAWRGKLLIPIRHENQGVCTWAVEIDGSDDPPVLIEVDTQGREWTELAPHFSDYVYSCVWDYRNVLHQPGLVQAQNQPLSDKALQQLDELLKPELRTFGWPGSVQFRFRGQGFGVLVWNSEQQADWFVGAVNRESLRAGVSSVWSIDSVGDWFYECTGAANKFAG